MIMSLVKSYKMINTRYQSLKKRKTHLNLRNPLSQASQFTKKAKMTIELVDLGICLLKLQSLSTLKSIQWRRREEGFKAELHLVDPNQIFNKINNRRFLLEMIFQCKRRMISCQWSLEVALDHFRSLHRKFNRWISSLNLRK